jgi:hypothetical protein
VVSALTPYHTVVVSFVAVVAVALSVFGEAESGVPANEYVLLIARLAEADDGHTKPPTPVTQ